MKRFILKTTFVACTAVFMTAPVALLAQQAPFDSFRAYDLGGLNVFEPVPTDTLPFDEVKVRFGVGFAQQLQAISHTNKAAERLVEGTDLNKLADIGVGANLATANLNLDAQLADGIRLNLVTYLSSRHHSEAWVKGGYLQIEKLTMLNSALIDRVMENVMIKAGHMEINYGDAHFRRTDNGAAMHNPFVGNLIMDAFTTEVGGEVYYFNNGFLAMAGITTGELNPSVISKEDKSPAFLGKIGYDSYVADDVRVRLTGSLYTANSDSRNTLYGGDRTGSRYYNVMENTVAPGFTSGRVNPGLTNKVTSIMVNPFVKVGGLEFFGVYETTAGKASAEVEDRRWNQLAGEVIYRFLEREQLYIGARYNTLNGQLAPANGVAGNDVTIDRVQVGGGWFLTDNILLKGEYVNQQYKGYAETSIFHGGEFKGFVFEGVIAF
ncbi:hypothetical protein [Nafulsella turpanensis]|uniref:hypothetical protein n=1 Tax=Nafulsella turpanensis TaxID=1265690 RepID=UPI00047748CC|nr:hypothetical protein [Nafulsella turpanensis]